MTNENKQRLYTSPELLVIETKTRTVVCQSNTSTSIEDMPEITMEINFE